MTRGIGPLGPQPGDERASPPPAGHTNLCWVSACPVAGRGAAPETLAVREERARAMIEGGFCRCGTLNKGVRGRRQRG